MLKNDIKRNKRVTNLLHIQRSRIVAKRRFEFECVLTGALYLSCSRYDIENHSSLSLMPRWLAFLWELLRRACSIPRRPGVGVELSSPVVLRHVVDR